jgi:C4-dicarboxylate-specific signal transduction histidine kinase
VFIPAILLSAWYGGIGPGLLAAGLSIVGSHVLLAQPRLSVLQITANDAVYLLFFSFTALFVAWLTASQREKEHALRRAHSELSARVADLAEANARLQAEVIERKQTSEALREAQVELARVTRVTMLGEITASIAHEVNQPLAAVVMSGNACRRWLAADPPNLEEAQAAVQRVIADGNRASDVVRRIRSLLQRQVAERVEMQINEVIGETVDFTRSELARHHVSLRTELGGELPPVVGDRVGLQQVLVNLILNGADAMSGVAEASRVLTLRSRADGREGVVVEVQDRGKGLDPEHASRIFEAFFSTKPGGLGMGLAISRSIVEAHGGRLRAIPNDGAGTTLHFTLPLEARGAS